VPVSGTVGSSITIQGSGFSSNVSDNTVLFGTIKATVTAASPGSLTVTVPNGAVYGPIKVVSEHLSATSSISFSITSSGCPGLNNESFLPKTDFTVGSSPANTYAGDIDMDGNPDLVVVNSYSNTVSVLRNNETNGVLSFSPGVDIITNYYPQKIVMADLDGDAKPEMIVLNRDALTISVFKNLSLPGVISFAERNDIQVGYYVVDFAVCDADGDGKTDVAVANSNAYTISILRNTSSNGTISFANKVDFRTGSVRPVKLSTGDLDQDGKPDITIGGFNYFNDSIAVFKNTSTKGAISFNAGISFPNEGGVAALSIGDVDGDNLPDLIAANGIYNKVSILRHSSIRGSIDFQPTVDLPTEGNNVHSISLGDLDGDNKADLTIVNSFSNSISIFRNNSTADTILFADKLNYATGNFPIDVAIADFDLNGKSDLIVSNNNANSISVYLKIASQKIFLVDSSQTGNTTVTGLCNVSSMDWTNACSNLQAALNAAQPGDQIWVAKGTYFPMQDSLGDTNSADASTKTFVMKSGVKVYGGFWGTETSLAERSGSLPNTILSGELRINGGVTKVNNVVWFSQVQNNTVLNGFTIEGGAATNNDYNGGGIYMNASSPVISNCVIKDNSSKNLGGAVYLNNSNPSFINCSIYNNSATYGGAIATNNAAPVIINCTIVKNAASDSGGGVYVQSGSSNAINSIIWGNTGANGIQDNVVSTEGSLVASYSVIGQEKDVYPGTGNKNANPLFVDGTNNDFNLLNSSWAVTGGDAASYPSMAPATDLNGSPRVNSTISMGAFQGGKKPLLNSTGIIYVNNAQQNLFANGYSWALAYANLSDALVVLNNNNNASEIWVTKGKYHPANYGGSITSSSVITNLTFDIKRGGVYGGFAGNETSRNQRKIADNETILDGLDSSSYAYPFNLYSVVSVLNAYSEITLDGFTITNGVGYYQAHGGGAIAVQSSKVTVNACKILNNTGAGIYSRNANLTITKCYFSGNAGQYGGAISNNECTAVISDCDFIDNVPVYGNNYAYGGAIANTASTVSITRCNFEGNKSVGAGGAMYNTDNSNVTVSNCKFTGNQTSEGGNGGAIANYTSSIAFVNCTFIKNFAQSGGALDNLSSTSLFTNCSFTDNRAYYDGGILNRATSTVKLSNCIIWGNTSIYDKRGDNLFNYDSNSPTGGFTIEHSLIGYGTDIYPGIGNINADPKFADTANADIRLLPRSPAIDAGADTAYTGNLQADFDVYGAQRLQGSSIDMGATEYNAAILPVTWLNFSVQQQNSNAVLTWVVANQVNNQYFQIEVADDGSNFHVIGKVPATAGSTYSFTDINFSRSIGAYAYYRIKHVDKDGRFTYSEIKRLRVIRKDFVFSIVENPVKGNEIKISIQSPDDSKGVIKIFDMNGKQVMARNITWLSGGSQQRISTPYLAGGTYLISLTTTRGQYQVKFIR